MGRGVLLAAVLAGLSAGPSRALEVLSPEAFLNIAEGKTLTFVNYGSDIHAGVEQFLSRERTIWKPGDRGCHYGRIVTDERRICFIYEGIPATQGTANCWWMFQDDGRIIARPAGYRGRGMQYVSAIREEPVMCPEIPVS